jgi:ABC-type nickel/cobalt efflux system permease component RcnA
MNSSTNTLVILVVLAIALIFVFRGCKQMDIHQRSDDNKASLTVEMDKKHHHHHHADSE